MSSLLEPQDSVVPPPNQMAQPTYLGYQYGDNGSIFHFPVGGSPISYPTSQSYSHQNAAQLGITKGASDNEDSMSSLLDWDPSLSTPHAVASPRLATADMLQPPRRREQQKWTLPDGTLGNTRTGFLPNYSAVADFQRSVSDPNHGSHVFNPSGAIGASRQDLASVPRSVSGPSTLGLASHNQRTHEFPVLTSGLDANQQLPPNSQLPRDSQLPSDSQLTYDSLNDYLTAYPPDTKEDDFVPYGLESQFSALAPPIVGYSQACQPPKDLEAANQCRVGDATIPGWDVPAWTPPYGQPNVYLGPEHEQNFALQEVNRKKRGREELGPLDGEDYADIFTEFEDHPPMGLNLDQGPRIEKHYRSEALPWDADDLAGLPRNKRLRLGNGNASFVDTTSPEHEDGPSAINEQLFHPDSLQGSSSNSITWFFY